MSNTYILIKADIGKIEAIIFPNSPYQVCDLKNKAFLGKILPFPLHSYHLWFSNTVHQKEALVINNSPSLLCNFSAKQNISNSDGPGNEVFCQHSRDSNFSRHDGPVSFFSKIILTKEVYCFIE